MGARAYENCAVQFSVVGLRSEPLHPIHTSLATCCRLLSDPASALYDLAAIYYGASPSFSCAACARTWARRGLKWQLVRALTLSPEWEELAAGYQYIMLVWRAQLLYPSHARTEAPPCWHRVNTPALNAAARTAQAARRAHSRHASSVICVLQAAA